MDRTAIQELEGLAAAAFEIRRAADGGDPLTIVPDDWQVRDLEHFLPAPTRARGNVQLQDAASFVDWINERKGEATRIYATAPFTGLHYAAVMDDTLKALSPTWRDWRGVYSPLPSPEWAIWSGANGKRVAQKDFAEYMEQNADDIVSTQPDEPTSAQILELAGNLTATTKAEFSSAYRTGNGTTSLRYSETTSAQGGQGNIEVPDSFYIGIPVFVGGPVYKIGARLRYRITGQQLTMGFDLIRPHKVIEAAAAEITANIREKTGLQVYCGQP